MARRVASTASSTQNNSGTDDKWEGAELTLWCTAAAATNGSGALALSIERSTDASTTWPTEGRGMNLGGAMVLVAETARRSVA